MSDKVRALEQEVAGKAEELLDGFDKRLREKAAGSDGADGDGTSGPPSAGTTERREAFLTTTIVDARALRDELVAFLAVYVERDPTYARRLGLTRGRPSRNAGRGRVPFRSGRLASAS